MTEREKMLRGEFYDASDSELAAARVRARRLVRRLAALDPGATDEARELLGELLGEVGEGSWIEPPFACDYGTQIRLGARVFVNMNCVFLDGAAITVGDDVQIGPAVQLLTADHPRDMEERARGLEFSRPITIGAAAWLGAGAIVLPGVEIGEGAVVGAGSVVTRSFAPGVTVAGNPCRIIKGADRP